MEEYVKIESWEEFENIYKSDKDLIYCFNDENYKPFKPEELISFQTVFDVVKYVNSGVYYKKVAKKHEVEIDDTSAFGIAHHDHNQHRVYVRDLTHNEALDLKKHIERYYEPVNTGVEKPKKSFQEFCRENGIILATRNRRVSCGVIYEAEILQSKTTRLAECDIIKNYGSSITRAGAISRLYEKMKRARVLVDGFSIPIPTDLIVENME